MRLTTRQRVETLPRMARHRLDERDIAILSILSVEGRISKTELARRVNLSATPCWERLRRLEESGLIRGYRAEVALERLGPQVTVFVLCELDSHKAESFDAFERAVRRYDEVTAAWALGGGFDYLLQAVTADIAAYQTLIDAMLAARIGLKRYFTYVVVKSIKDAPPPIALLAAGGSEEVSA